MFTRLRFRFLKGKFAVSKLMPKDMLALQCASLKISDSKASVLRFVGAIFMGAAAHLIGGVFDSVFLYLAE